MALSAEIISSLTEELSDNLTEGKIEKIQQPEPDLMLITVRRFGENHRLLIRCAGPNARIHLTEQIFENPASAPMFCMLLRKHLTGARIRGVRQPNGDRILLFDMESRNELGDRADLQLIVELTGRATNLILTDSDGRIVDCMRRVPPGEHTARALLPGLRYEYPPLPAGSLSGDGKAFSGTDSGTGTSGRDTAADLPDSGISAWLDARYAGREREELQRRRSQELVRTVRRTRDRQQRKLAAQSEELRRTENMETVRREAELLQANLYRVHRGDRVLECEDYYQEELPQIRIGLDPLKTPQQNLAARFREYRKLKGAQEHLTGLIADGERQLDYLNSVLDELLRAESERDLDEIRTELQETGLLRRTQGKRPGKKKQKPSEPLRYESRDGFEILVGRNNTQNDELTFRFASGNDWWFHAKGAPGSHVILKNKGVPVPDSAFEDAARLAAWYSKNRANGKVEIDYVQRKEVKKPAGSKPGFVVYYTNYSMVIDTDISKMTLVENH